MKTRTGFVSNSSSSSFVFFGVKNPPNAPKFEWPEEAKREDWTRLDQEYEEFKKKWGYLTVGYGPREEILYGILLADEQTGFPLGETEISITELLEKAMPLALELGVPVESFKLITGERSS